LPQQLLCIRKPIIPCRPSSGDRLIGLGRLATEARQCLVKKRLAELRVSLKRRIEPADRLIIATRRQKNPAEGTHALLAVLQRLRKMSSLSVIELAGEVRRLL